ncbi:Zinc-finger homeodomain protein 8 [Bienertia sinuspersici]
MAMDFISGPTNVTTAAAATATVNIPRSPDSDTDTPPHPPPSKRAHHHLPNNNQMSENVHVSYKECLKNHAASIGGHALDGCCEFMPGPTVNPMDPTSLTCAACGCHRNFHRRDPDDPTPLHHLVPPSAVARKPHSPPSASQLLLSLSGHTRSPSAPSDHEAIHNPPAVSGGGVVMGYYNHNNGGGGSGGGQNGNFQSKKRFRTKFSQEQKEKMYEFSEKIGWKLKKGEERLVEDFCKQVGVDRSVFKVWMHNNKHSSSASASTPLSSSQKQKDQKTSSSSNNGNHQNNNNNNNLTSSNVGLNCGGMLASGIEFNFANGGAQEAKAQ